MARASTHTLLSLDQYAQILGINPAHFNSATGGTVMPVGNCNDVWYQFTWQAGNRASREDLAYAILEAEEDIARVVGYYPAPRWISDEVHPYPRFHRPDLQQRGGLNVYGQRKSITSKFGKVVTVGRRAVTLIGTPTTAGGTITYTDADGDGYAETATVTQTTTLTDECELNVYFQGESGDQEWEIRPARTKAISGGTFTATYWTWQFILPSLWDQFLVAGTTTDPVAPLGTIDTSNTANLVTSVDVYREYTDSTQASCQLFWEPHPRNVLVVAGCSACSGTGCEACSFTTQDGCIHVRDNDRGFMVPQPATYSATDEQWSQVAFTECRDPDLVKIWYYAGDLDERYLRGTKCAKLSRYWAEAITWLATARLGRPFCACASRLVDELREDLAETNASKSFNVGFDILNNPFGTRRGEVKAWQRVDKFLVRKLGAGAV